ncbi:PAP-associated domain-containing protein 5-like [Trifolium medium]|uniref:PAP-associated domain-containing protein 5-like n=1 Tax=Trifolium medium TaxID=97028 RepID=A0A392M5S8_9FABA|nr:PAP-associated domain-containing protein 5-like [Trifolium medium]
MSILGTIIRPDPVLMEHKGGSNGEMMTFNSLPPGVGEPIQQQYGEYDMLCNWQLDFEEEPLPRRDGENTRAEPSTPSSKKKRKSAPKENKENRDSRKNKENGSMTENSEHKKHKKKRTKHNDRRPVAEAEPAIALGFIQAGALQNATAAVPGAAQSYSVVANWKI